MVIWRGAFWSIQVKVGALSSSSGASTVLCRVAFNLTPVQNCSRICSSHHLFCLLNPRKQTNSTGTSEDLLMAQQDEGWPLGLRPLNARLGLMRNLDFSGSASFNTLLTASPTSSTISSSDLDSETAKTLFSVVRTLSKSPVLSSTSTGSFFHDKSKTLGSLIGVSGIFELSRRSTRGRTAENLRDRKSFKSKPWLLSLCSKLTTDAVTANNNIPSLGHFLEAERTKATASNLNTRNQIPLQYGPNDYSPVPTVRDVNSLVADGLVAPQRSTPSGDANHGVRFNSELFEDGSDLGVPLPFPCLCGQVIK
ncbi:hypothetical protein PanWU01x14_311440 [Parasponia andersonii]|uniref:Uncharacterized protein n=1 Tax=Parasponia andersonii TaxID=3476 RepID=A0A2P5APV7_PARAD|nr:hypothetical protein PanWU01x14_311440 [Parasponia andersonii]